MQKESVEVGFMDISEGIWWLYDVVGCFAWFYPVRRKGECKSMEKLITFILTKLLTGALMRM